MTQPDAFLDLDLPTSRDRFLARVVDHALADGWRTPKDFLTAFPPEVIMRALQKDDARRAALLVATTGVHEKIAIKKTIESATEDLTLALAEGITDPARVLAAYPLEDRIRTLPGPDLFAFVADADFAGEDAPERLTFVVEAALAEKLVTLTAMFDGLTFDEIANCLPPDDLRAALTHALRSARTKKTLSEERFLEVVPLARLLEVMPPDHVWERVIMARVAAPAGFVEASSQVSSDAAVPPTEPAKRAERVAGRTDGARARDGGRERKPATELDDLDRLLGVEAAVTVEAEPDEPAEIDVQVDVEPSRSKPEYEDAARDRAVERLRAIERLPPRYDDLSLAHLLSIESMYADLDLAHDDADRESVMLEAFPNDVALRTGILALIELLDPKVDTSDPVIQDAEIRSLVKVVLFEERRRALAGLPRPRRSLSPPSMKLTPPPPPPTSRPTSSLPPPPRRLAPMPSTSSAPPPRSASPSRQAATLLSLDDLQREVHSARVASTH